MALGIASDVMAFSTPHRRLDEVVGVVLVHKGGEPRVGLPQLHKKLAAAQLHPYKWPRLIVYMNGYPSTCFPYLQVAPAHYKTQAHCISGRIPLNPATSFLERLG